MSFEVRFVRVKHAIEPWQQLLGTMVGMKNYGNTICRSNGANIVSTGDSTGNRGGLVGITDALRAHFTVSRLPILLRDLLVVRTFPAK